MSAPLIVALIIWAAFYVSFFAKMLLMKKRGINSNLLGRGQKPEKARRVEVMLKAVTFTGAPIQLFSIFFVSAPFSRPLPGLILSAAGTAFFIWAMLAMRDNWRSGYDLHQNTTLVVSGPYKISRNPAFVGFDLLYIGWALAFPNIFNLIISVAALIVFHRQIVEEELFLESAFGREYELYKMRVNRYMGRKTL